MSTVTGYVKEIYEGTTKWGQLWWSITLDTGTKISTREPKFREEIEEGKEYTFTYESDGTYANITAPSVPVIHTDTETIAPNSTTAPLTHEPAEMPPRVFGTASNKDEAIRKAVALKAAVEYVASVLGGTGTTKDVISYAREFEEYLK